MIHESVQAFDHCRETESKILSDHYHINGRRPFKLCRCGMHRAGFRKIHAITTGDDIYSICKYRHVYYIAWRRHQMETFCALLTLCVGISPVPGEFPAQKPVTRRFDVFFDLRLNKQLSKQSWGWQFETPSRSPWRHGNGDAHTAEIECYKGTRAPIQYKDVVLPV